MIAWTKKKITQAAEWWLDPRNQPTTKCQKCGEKKTAWKTYHDGTVLCLDCDGATSHRKKRVTR